MVFQKKKSIRTLSVLTLTAMLLTCTFGCAKKPADTSSVSGASSVESSLNGEDNNSLSEDFDSSDADESGSSVSTTGSGSNTSSKNNSGQNNGNTNNSQGNTGTQTKQYRDYFSNISYQNPIPRLKNSPSSTPIAIQLNSSMPRWQRYMLSAFEGLANRKQARIYLNWEASDAEWMRRWSDKSLYGFRFQEKSSTDVYSMIMNDVDHYNVKGLLIYDESIINQSTWSMLINVYTGICGAEDLIPVPSSQRNNFKDLPVVFDATQGGKKLGKWDSESEAYIWVINQYKTLSRKGAPMAHQHPSCLREVDYYVQNKMIPIFYWKGMTQAVKDKFREVFLSTGTNGLMVGCWDIPTYNDPYSAERGKPGVGGAMNFVKTDGDMSCEEHRYLHLISGYGKATLTTAEKGVQNMSFQAGIPLKYSKPAEVPAKPTYNKNKNYMALHVSDGDNMCYINEAVDGGFGMTTSRWWSEASRGVVPVSWSIGTGAADLLPGAVSYLYSTATENDTFVSATSGWGYILISAYGKFLPSGTDRNAELQKFYRTTGTYQKRMGITSQHVLWSYYKDYETNRSQELADMRLIVAAIKETNPSFSGLIAEYGTNDRRNIPAKYRVEDINGTPMFNAVNTIENHLLHEQTQDTYLVKLVNHLNGLTAQEKKFMHVFCTNWFVRPNSLEELVNRMGSGYEAVPANYLGDLWKQAK